MTNHFVAHQDGKWRVYRLVNGIYRLTLPPVFATPKAAMAYAAQLDNAQNVSPLRPATRSGAPDLAGAGTPRVAETSRRTGSPDRPPSPEARSG